MVATPKYIAKLSAVPSFSAKFRWGGEGSATLYLNPGERVVVPGYLTPELSEWGNQKWKFLRPEDREATRHFLKVQCEADGPLLVQKWNGYQDVTANAALVLPVVGKIYTGSDNSFVYVDEHSVDLAVYNPGAFPAKIFIQAVYDAPLEAVGVSGGIDWSQIVWSGIINHLPGGGAVSGVYVGANWAVSARGPSGAASAYSEAVGQMNYAGPAQHCFARVVTTAGPSNFMGFIIFQDAAILLTVNTAAIGVPGNYSFPFTVAQSAGSVLRVKGLVDVADPNRLFVYDFSNTLGAYSARVEMA